MHARKGVEYSMNSTSSELGKLYLIENHYN